MTETINRLRHLNRLRRFYKREYSGSKVYAKALEIQLAELRKRQLEIVGGTDNGVLQD